MADPNLIAQLRLACREIYQSRDRGARVRKDIIRVLEAGDAVEAPVALVQPKRQAMPSGMPKAKSKPKSKSKSKSKSKPPSDGVEPPKEAA